MIPSICADICENQTRRFRSGNGNEPLSGLSDPQGFPLRTTDASHDSVFHQFEGMMADHFEPFFHHFLNHVGEVFESEVRLRPGYFPVEPGFELIWMLL
jgi:phenylalanyl-tRNA synthetase alpha subunit